jgi:hypothetical protein
LIFILAIAMVCGTAKVLAESPASDAGVTYTFKGGLWSEPSSWEPSSVPGMDDNVVIPYGFEAKAPPNCELGTLTLDGGMTVENLGVKSFEITYNGKLQSTGDMSIDCRGNAKNSGLIKPSGKLTFKCMGLENLGRILPGGSSDFMSIGSVTNKGTIESKGYIAIQCAKLTNSGLIATRADGANIIIWSFGQVENNGSLIGYSGLTKNTGDGENGGSILVACSSFVGNGAVAPGNGGDGYSPGKKGVAYIGSMYTQASFVNQAPPQGAILDEKAWKIQTSKANPRDGRKIGASVSGNLTLQPPTNSKPFRLGGYSSVVNCNGGKITANLKWEGSGIVRINGRCSLEEATFTPHVTYLGKGETFPVTLNFSQRNPGVEEIRIVFETADRESYVSLKLTVFFIKCPIIEGKFGQTKVTVTDDLGVKIKRNLSKAAFVRDGILLVPLRDFIETNHGNVGWNAQTKQASFEMPGRLGTFAPNSANASLNGNTQKLPANTCLIDGRLMVPAQTLAEMIGASLTINGNSYVFKYPG